MDKRIKIAFDLDGTLADLMTVFIPILESMTGKDLKEWRKNRTNYNLVDKEMGIDIKMINKALKMSYGMHKYTTIYPMVTELMHFLYTKTGEPPHIITARPIRAAEFTHKLVRRLMHGVPYLLTFSGGPDTKHIFLKPYEYFVEDRRKIALGLEKLGWKIFLLDKPYNQIEEYKPRIERIKSFETIWNTRKLFI